MPAEWLIERGIGEARAALVDDGNILELRIEREGGLKAGAIRQGRLTSILVPGKRSIVVIDGAEALLEPLPPGVTQGATLFVEIVREAIPESGRPRLPKAVPSAATAESQPPALKGRELRAHEPDRLEAAGWSEAIEEARSGVVPFDGGTLAIALTPAMTLIDIDGALPPGELAAAGAKAAALAIRRHGIGGSIGIDFPTLKDKAARTAVAEIIDAHLSQPFERTAVNGFGFLQIVRRRSRASMFELVQGAPVETAALALLRQAERATGAGVRELTAAPAVIDWLAVRPALTAELERRIGAAVRLNPDPARAISAGHVHSRSR